MADPLPVPREAIDRFVAEHGVTRVPRGLSGIFDEQGNYRTDPFRGNRARINRASQAAAARRRADYIHLFDSGEPPERIAELMQVSVETVKQTAVKLGRADAAGCAPRKSVVNDKIERAAPPAAPAPPQESETRAAYRAMHAAGMSTGSIAEAMGVTAGHVRRMLWALDLTPNPPLHFRS